MNQPITINHHVKNRSGGLGHMHHHRVCTKPQPPCYQRLLIENYQHLSGPTGTTLDMHLPPSEWVQRHGML